MKVPFDGVVPQHYYEMALAEAATLFPGAPSELTSIKIRPLSKWPLSSDSDFHNAYVYPVEYRDLYSWLHADGWSESGKGTVSRGKATLYTKSNGAQQIVFVEHETGPEIVACLVLAAAVVSLVKEIVVLVREALITINDRNNEKKAGATDGRYYEAAAVSIEERTKDYTRIVTIVPLPLDPTALTVEQLTARLRARSPSE